MLCKQSRGLYISKGGHISLLHSIRRAQGEREQRMRAGAQGLWKPVPQVFSQRGTKLRDADMATHNDKKEYSLFSTRTHT